MDSHSRPARLQPRFGGSLAGDCQPPHRESGISSQLPLKFKGEGVQNLSRMAYTLTSPGTLKAKDSLIMQGGKSRSLGRLSRASIQSLVGSCQCQSLVLSVLLWQQARCALETHTVPAQVQPLPRTIRACPWNRLGSLLPADDRQTM